MLAEEGVSLLPLFGASEERLQHETMSLAATAIPGAQIPNLSVYYFVPAPDERLEEIAAKLLQQPGVDGAYVKPRAELAQTGMGVARGAVLNDMAPLPQDAPPLSPDFTARQLYLGAAPVGIDARYAWTQTGGAGFDVRIIDCEWAWRFTHEDLVQTQGGAVVGTPNTNLAFRNHGTAVVGEFSGDRNAFGITGICPDATVSGAAFSGPTAATIRQAADRLRPGDILLLEIHRAGPHATGIGQQGYIAIEWWPDDFDAIRYAISKGVLVVEAAGNGAENLDDPIYSIRPAGFPSTWTNPFNRANRDSGAIVVGAGSPPPGTHGRDWGPDRSRLDFSNYGALIDAQGWGREVTTTGYGDLQGGVSEDLWYTDQFSGTSSASPIVVGALGCVQGYLRAHGRIPLTPARARDLLRTTGSPQQDAPGRPRTQRIGNRPNLRQMIPAVAPVPQPFVGVQFRGTIPAGQTRRWFTFNWPSQWHVLWT
ncbi:MAG: S8 family peptidase, partial [Gammaproteobacteria bacterium]